jgi:hypothetical protein
MVEKLSSMALPEVVGAARLETVEIVHQGGGLAPLAIARLDRISSRALHRIGSVAGTAAEIAAQIDHLVLGLAVTKLYDGLSGGTMPALIVPVSFSTFTHRRSAEHYLGLCRTLLKGTAKYLFFELCEVPDDAANMRIAEIVASLRPYSRAQWLRVSRLDPLPAKEWLKQFSQITVLYRDIEPSLQQQPERFRTCLHTLRARRCRILVHMVPSQTAARCLADAGIDFVSGSGLLPWGAAMSQPSTGVMIGV